MAQIFWDFPLPGNENFVPESYSLERRYGTVSILAVGDAKNFSLNVAPFGETFSREFDSEL